MAIERGVFTDKLKFGFGMVYYPLNPAMMSSYGYHRTRCRQDHSVEYVLELHHLLRDVVHPAASVCLAYTSAYGSEIVSFLG